MNSKTSVQLPDTAVAFRWLLRARWIAVSALGVFACLAHFRGFLDTIWPLLGVVAVAGAYNVVLFRVVNPQKGPRVATRWSLCLDLLTLTVFLYFSGDLENPLCFAYAIPVVAGAILLSSRSAVGLAFLATLLLSGLIFLTHFDRAPIRLPHNHLALLPGVTLHELFDPDITGAGWDYLVWTMVALVMVLFGAALGSGALSTHIRRQNERMMLLLANLPDGVVLVRRDGGVVFANGIAGNLFPSLESGTIHGLGAEVPLAEHMIRVSQVPLRFETLCGDRILEHAVARASPEGPYVWVIHDVTSQRRLMAQVIHQSKMVDLGLLGAGIAHEIGNPLSSMAAVIEVLQMKHIPPELAERLRSLRTHVDRIDRIVKDVTGYARPSEGRETIVDASTIAAKALEIFRMHERSRDVKIVAAPPQAPAPIRAVEDQIVQVVLNLLLNAADASAAGGEIRIEIRRAGGEAEIVVADRGTGISDEGRRRLFTPFFTTKEPGKGVGLGLFVSESIIREHGGRIRVDSAVRRGCTFTVCLPLAGAS
jgi:signal transduction histidine kinase